MTPEHWKKVEEVFESALQQPPSERSAFLRVACEGDESLRNQVETLLLSLDRAGSFMEASAFGARLSDTVVEETPSVIGMRLGSYRIVKEIGRGGMGSVYLAIRADDEFQKRVAIKLIKRGMDTDFIVKRFRNERQILASLDHPHIARLLDGGTTEDGLPYFVMEYVEGEPLYRYSDTRRLSIGQRLELFRKVCSAVHYAHLNLVIHRDLKPSNILVNADGTPKLLDFGIAKLLNPELAYHPLDPTTAAIRLMTPEYASPEQVRGETLTAGSDVYALGVMLYELLTDHRPYKLTSHLANELARVICEQEPELPSIAVNIIEVIGDDGDDLFEITPATVSKARSTTSEQLKRELAGSLDNIILKAMHKDVARRYNSVEELSEDIRRYLDGRPVAAPSYFPSPTRSSIITADPSTASRSIAVLPFQVLRLEEKGEEFLGMGLADAIITKLSNIQRIIVRPTSAVIKYFDGTHNILTAGHELNVGFVLDGRIQRAGDRIRVTVQLISVRDGQPVWAAKFDENYTDIFSVEDSISEQVAHALVPHLSGEERELLLRRETENANAYQAFLKGRYLWTRFTPEGFTRAVEQFREAIRLDPNYAQAYVGIADYYNWAAIFGLGSPADNFPLAKAAAIRALEIDGSLAEAHAALAFTNLCYEWNWTGAEQRFRRSIELNSNYGPAHQWYSNLLAGQGRFAEAIAEINHALELNPLSMMDRSMAGWTYYHARQYERAEQELRAALEVDRNFSNCYLMLGFVYERLGRYDESINALHKALELMSGSVVPLLPLAYTLAMKGNQREAREILERLHEHSDQHYVSPYFFALIHTGLGETEEAFKWLEKAVETHDEWMVWLGVEPKLDPLRGDPRFADLLKQVGLKGDEANLAMHYSADHSSVDFSSSGDPRVRTGEVLKATPTLSDAVFAVYRDHRRERRWVIGLIGLAAVIALSVFAYYKLARVTPSRFASIQIDKLTAAGNVFDAAISPDGKYLAFVMDEAGGQGLWVGQTAIANRTRLVPPTGATFRGLSFSKDGNYVYYVSYEPGAKHGSLYRIPTFGGSVRKVNDDVDGPVSFSPDAKQFAFIRNHEEQGEDLLLIANEDGSGEQQIASMKFPGHFSLRSSPAWSPDGKLIATVAETSDENGFFSKLSAIDIASKKETVITTRRWLELSDVGWLPDGSGLIVSGQEASSPFYHLWLIDRINLKERKITRDLNDYLAVSLSSNPLLLMTVQRQTLTNIWVEHKDNPSQATPLTSGAGRFFDLRWTSDNKIIYASDASGNADIWEMASDGSNQTQLTAAAGRNYAPVASPDGKYVVFHSNRSGNWQIWRMGRDGSNSTQLTRGKEESNWPDVSPDGRWVYFEHIDGGTPKVWKISIDGGEPERVTDKLSLRPSVAPSGKAIAYWEKDDSPTAPWRIAVATLDGSEPTKFLNVPQGDANGQSAIQFSSGGETVTFIDFNNGVSRLVSQPVDGSAARILTSVNRDLFYSFNQAPDGKLVMARGIRTSDAVLISERK